MISVSEICDTLGRLRLAAALGVGKTSVSNAAVSGEFPSSWFRVVRDLCEVEGLECPEDLFNFKPPPPPSADAGAGEGVVAAAE